MSALPSLIEHAIPEGRQNLENSYANLERVAAYCEANYLQSADKRAAVEETKRYAVQSLASVAYQINMLASNLLRMMDLQAENIGDMESQVSNIAQIVNIHKEKVERREIGVLTANKSVPRQHKIIAPSHQEKPQKYIRRPIDYSVLDDIGHGVKVHQGQNPRLLARTGSTVSACSSGSGGVSIAAHGQSQGEYAAGGGSRFGSMAKGSSSREYRAPITIAPPTAPVFQGPDYVCQRYPNLVQTNQMDFKTNSINMGPSRLSGYTSVSVVGRASMPADPYSGDVPPVQPQYVVHHQALPGINRMGQLAQPQVMEDCVHQPDDYFAPPPAPEDFYADQESPLPPPPPALTGDYGSGQLYGDAVPPNYIEKVIAIYDYQAHKPDELSFKENSVIYVLKKNEDGWYEGVLHGVTGLFPGNYVEVCM